MKTLLILLFASFAFAQDNSLSIQGVLRQPSGKAVADGTYSITFTFYTVETGGTAIDNGVKTQDIDIKDGLYNANVDITGIPFDAQYYIGIKVGSNPELAPRIKLTAAPYALSLRGLDNIFPSTGTVSVGDSLLVDGPVIAESSLYALGGMLMYNKGSIQYGGTPGAVTDNTMGLYSISYQQPMKFVTDAGWFNFYGDGGSNPNGGTAVAHITNQGGMIASSFKTTNMQSGIKYFIAGEFTTNPAVMTVGGNEFDMYYVTGFNDGKYLVVFKNGLNLDPSTYVVVANTVSSDNFASIHNKTSNSFHINTYNINNSAALESTAQISFIVISYAY